MGCQSDAAYDRNYEEGPVKFTVIVRLNIILSSMESFGMTFVVPRIADIIKRLLQCATIGMLTQFVNIAGSA